MWVVKANDNTFINVVIVDSEVMTEPMRQHSITSEIVIQIQCVDTGDLYSRSVFYSTAQLLLVLVCAGTGVSQFNGTAYVSRVHVSYVISIWIIKNKIKERLFTKTT